jgi:hypothetical protein
MSQSITSDRISESTVARIAGNLLSGYAGFYVVDADDQPRREDVVQQAVAMARLIVAEVQRTRPQEQKESK